MSCPYLNSDLPFQLFQQLSTVEETTSNAKENDEVHLTVLSLKKK